MQLRLQRTQRAGGIAGGTVFFCLDARADYSQEERSNINRYKLGGQTLYNSRAAQKHLEASGAHLERTQEGSAGNRLIGLARGAASLALAKMQLNISIASLGRGHHVECKDLQELLETEDTLRNACKELTKYLEVAATFDGSEVVIEYEKGEEKVHITQGAVPLLSGPDGSYDQSKVQDAVYENVPQPSGAGPDPSKWLEAVWANPTGRRLVYIVGGLILAIILLRSCG